MDRRIHTPAAETPALPFYPNAPPVCQGLQQNYPLDSFADPFSGVLVCGGEAAFAGSFGAADFSPPAEVAGDSFLAASLYESLR